MTTFEDHGLRGELIMAISEMGFVNPTPIQEKTIPALLETKNDLIALAQTGTGNGSFRFAYNPAARRELKAGTVDYTESDQGVMHTNIKGPGNLCQVHGQSEDTGRLWWVQR